MKPIQEILNGINVPDKAEVYSPIGRYMAKIKSAYLEKIKDKKNGKLILVVLGDNGRGCFRGQFLLGIFKGTCRGSFKG